MYTFSYLHLVIRNMYTGRKTEVLNGKMETMTKKGDADSKDIWTQIWNGQMEHKKSKFKIIENEKNLLKTKMELNQQTMISNNMVAQIMVNHTAKN